jgi:hypothetical protein
MKRLGPLTDSRVGIFTEQQVDLFKPAAIGFHSRKTPHLDNCGGYFGKLLHRGNILPR